jgi:hypothetical protein
MEDDTPSPVPQTTKLPSLRDTFGQWDEEREVLTRKVSELDLRDAESQRWTHARLIRDLLVQVNHDFKSRETTMAQ